MDTRRVNFTAAANRESSWLYQDLAECLAPVSFSDSDISDLIMDTYQKVCLRALFLPFRVLSNHLELWHMGAG